jgi:hypothetical protein
MTEYAMEQPSINTIVPSDIYRLNAMPSAKYGVFCWTQRQHNVSADGNITFNFVLFYVDRLVADKSNETEIQDVGISTISNIIKLLNEDGYDIQSWTIDSFNQRFVDECAGVFANVAISAQMDNICGYDF